MGLKVKLAYLGAFVLRLVVFTQFALYFSDRPELVTPITNVKLIKEALFLEALGLSFYDGTAFHQPPLMVQLFRIPIAMGINWLFCLLLDFLAAWLIKRITVLYNQTAEAKEDRLENPPGHMGDMVALLYLYLPFSWTSMAAESTGLIDNVMLLSTLRYALEGNLLGSIGCLSVASYIAIYPIQLLVPLFFLFPSTDKRIIGMLFVSCIGVLVYISATNLDWMWESYGFILHVTDLTPNIGLFWYFFLEVFAHFRTFFCCVLQLNCFLYVIPLGITFKNRPTLLFWLLLAYITTLKPYPSVADLALQFGLLPLFYPIVSEFLMRFVIIAQVYLYMFILMPIAWYAWLYQGSGNANFYYATTLVIGAAQVWLIVEVLHLALERQYRRKHKMPPFDTKVKAQ